MIFKALIFNNIHNSVSFVPQAGKYVPMEQGKICAKASTWRRARRLCQLTASRGTLFRNA
jgi:hypothetical protein